MLTGEYVVLDGAITLALPTKAGQRLSVKENDSQILEWHSYGINKTAWFKACLDSKTLHCLTPNECDDTTSKRLIQILKQAQSINPNFIANKKGYEITTHLEFNRAWGLGSSSTLINNIANWAQINAYKLLENTFGGSGYDIACAQHDKAVLYQLSTDNQQRKVTPVNFRPSYTAELYFVYLNKKQNSRDGIHRYRNLNKVSPQSILKINNITTEILHALNLKDFCQLITEHENIIGNLIEQEPIQKRLFKDFNGSIKSLGAWGGDFILAASANNPTAYFKAKGYNTVIPYQSMIL